MLAASYISEQAFASQVVLLQIAIIFLAGPYALGTLANSLISDSIAFHDQQEAKAMAEIMQKYAILLAILSVMFSSLLRKDLLRLYTSDPEII